MQTCQHCRQMSATSNIVTTVWGEQYYPVSTSTISQCPDRGNTCCPPLIVSPPCDSACSTWGWHRKQSLQTPVVSSTHLAGPIRPTVGRQGSAERRYSGTSRSCVMECRSFPAPLRLKWLTVLVSPSLSHCVLGINGFLISRCEWERERKREFGKSFMNHRKHYHPGYWWYTRQDANLRPSYYVGVLCGFILELCVWCCLFMFCFFVTFVF